MSLKKKKRLGYCYCTVSSAVMVTVTCAQSNKPRRPSISSASGQITISWSSRTVSGCNHKPIYILMSMTLEGSVELAVLSDAKQRQGGKSGVLLKEVENQLTMICGNWQGILLECAYKAYSVTLCAFNPKSSKKHNYVYYFSPHKVSAIDPNWMGSVSHKIRHSVI